MNVSTRNTIVHLMALLAGIIGIIAGSASSLGLPAYAIAVCGVVISVLTYVSNQLPNLGSEAPAEPAPSK